MDWRLAAGLISTLVVSNTITLIAYLHQRQEIAQLRIAIQAQRDPVIAPADIG